MTQMKYRSPKATARTYEILEHIQGNQLMRNQEMTPYKNTRTIGRWGRMHRSYLQEHRPVLFNRLVLLGKLWSSLADLEEQAQSRFERVICQMMEAEGVTETLKENDVMEWVRRMNSIRNRAEEIVREELIFA